jgi:hypothetical protein
MENFLGTLKTPQKRWIEERTPRTKNTLKQEAA